MLTVALVRLQKRRSVRRSRRRRREWQRRLQSAPTSSRSRWRLTHSTPPLIMRPTCQARLPPLQCRPLPTCPLPLQRPTQPLSMHPHPPPCPWQHLLQPCLAQPWLSSCPPLPCHRHPLSPAWCSSQRSRCLRARRGCSAPRGCSPRDQAWCLAASIFFSCSSLEQFKFASPSLHSHRY